ncbi:MAG TPA: ribonuclease P [Halobacteriales archaeon]|jgi:ribonuclease P protein subunit RPR2|uniref:ribonuclease P protein component 4 n=1 Tax=Candidatus Hikarchaeum yamanae TaxID=2675326 RepID=UPI0018438D10|nr:ribonuclease P [Halobacteriales archaeon]HIJ13086.1 ribonuclease P [Halobacteriales archaeon]|tara:strand:- start:22639 stop:22953 length:315 start_codon:yes stop_codon:yes gene_type:complete
MIAEERIEKLAKLAKEAGVSGETVRAKRYVYLAHKIAQRHRLKFPADLKRFTCSKCGTYLIPGRNARFRTNNKCVVVSCECGEYHRYPYKGGTRGIGNGEEKYE